MTEQERIRAFFEEYNALMQRTGVQLIPQNNIRQYGDMIQIDKPTIQPAFVEDWQPPEVEMVLVPKGEIETLRQEAEAMRQEVGKLRQWMYQATDDTSILILGNTSGGCEEPLLEAVEPISEPPSDGVAD